MRWLVALALVAACGDNVQPQPDASSETVLADVHACSIRYLTPFNFDMLAELEVQCTYPGWDLHWEYTVDDAELLQMRQPCAPPGADIRMELLRGRRLTQLSAWLENDSLQFPFVDCRGAVNDGWTNE
ncbi:MAG TPA: hypothetical protein VFQ42_22180 [Mycobacterium sp.]|nr:hypothetical protein [Mycobacterium sp.]